MNYPRIAGVLALLGLVGCAYHAPAEPSAPAVDLSSTPSKMTLGAVLGAGLLAAFKALIETPVTFLV